MITSHPRTMIAFGLDDPEPKLSRSIVRFAFSRMIVWTLGLLDTTADKLTAEPDE